MQEKECRRSGVDGRFFWELFTTFFLIGAFTIGGGWAMLPLIERDVVKKRGWLTSEEFLNALAVAQSAPGAVVINAAVTIGFRLAGYAGSLVAVLGAVLPSFFIIILIASIFAQFRANTLVAAFFAGTQPAVVALLFAAAWSTGRKVIKKPVEAVLALAALLAVLVGRLHPIAVIVLGAVAGSFIYQPAPKAKAKGENGGA